MTRFPILWPRILIIYDNGQVGSTSISSPSVWPNAKRKYPSAATMAAGIAFVNLGDLRVKTLAKPERAAVLSEFGGYSLKVGGHLWNPSAEFGYKKFAASEALTEAYLDLLEKEWKPCVAAGLSAAIYTQTMDRGR